MTQHQSKENRVRERGRAAKACTLVCVRECARLHLVLDGHRWGPPVGNVENGVDSVLTPDEK